MTYFNEYDLAFADIMKNGTNVFTTLFEYVLGKADVRPFFLREPKVYISVVRNPYDRLVSQFYHVNRKIIWQLRYSVHFPFFRKWVQETYENKTDCNQQDDGHILPQNWIIQYYQYPLPYHIFKLEELIPHELFFFLELDDERKQDIDLKFNEIKIEYDNNGHHANNTLKQGIWQSFYDSKTIEICNTFFLKDFEAFNYEIIEPSVWKNIPAKLI